MNKTKVLALTSTLAASAIMMSSAHALLIDNFNSPAAQSVFQNEIGGGTPGPDTVVEPIDLAVGDTIGTSRELTVSATAGGPNFNQLSINGSVLGFSKGAAGADGSATIVWNSQGATFAPLQDLTDAGASSFISIDLVTIDLGTVNFFFSLTDGTGNTATTNLGASFGGQTVQGDFSSFANFGATDFTQIREISLVITGDAEQDITVDQIFTSGRITNNVPEPTPLLLLGIGVMGAGFTHRKKGKV